MSLELDDAAWGLQIIQAGLNGPRHFDVTSLHPRTTMDPVRSNTPIPAYAAMTFKRALHQQSAESTFHYIPTKKIIAYCD